MKSFSTLTFAVVLSSVVVGAHLLFAAPEASGHLQAAAKMGSLDRASAAAQVAYLPSTDRLPVPRMAGSYGVGSPSLPVVEVVATPMAPVAPVAPRARSQASAKAAVEADGYKGVTALSRQADGTWQARAMRGNTEVVLTISSGGSVSAN